ncbi:MAG TPA: hypothetical protein VNZ68_07020 [Rhodocyclaceae bacterium]|nr:hypothetical protein [Rhodocyclaceae bacterium]
MNKALVAVIAFALVGCVTMGNSKVRGETVADGRLAADTLGMLKYMTPSDLGCNDLDYIDTKTKKVEGKIITETWVAHGCGKSAAYDIEFIPAKQGGYFFGIKKAKAN